MQIRNTRETYGLIAIALHWIVAIGFIGSYASVYYRQWFTEAKTPENWTALQLHLSFGVTIAVFVVLRVIWKSMNIQPKDVPGAPIEHLAAHAVHWALYAFTVIMPITGYLGTGAATKCFFRFDIPKLADTPVLRIVV